MARVEELANEVQQLNRVEFAAFRDWFRKYDSKAFCEKHGLFAYLPIAEELINTHFPNVREVQTELMKDPEEEGEWLVISAKVGGEIEAVLDAYDRLTRDWVAAVPWPDREKIVLAWIST